MVVTLITDFCYDKDIWNVVIDYHIYFYTIVLFSLTSILLLINFTVSISHGVENYFPRLWGTGISDAIFF